MASKKDSNISKFPESEKKKKDHFSRKGLYTFSVIVLVLIVITFIGGPLFGSLGGRGAAGGRLIFGYYRGKPIEYAPGNYFARQLQMLERQAAETGAQQQDTQMQIYQIWRGAFDRTVLHKAVLHKAEQGGIPVSSEQVDRAIARNPEFQENGRFSARLYQRLSPQQQYQLRDLTRANLVHDRYLQDVLRFNTTAQTEKTFFSSMASPERSIEYVVFRFSQYPDSELSAFVQERPELFQSIEASTITLPKDQFNRSQAESIREEIAAGDTFFEDAARDHSSDIFADAGGNAGILYYYDLLPDYPSSESVDAIFAVEQGNVSTVIESNFAYVIYQINRGAQPADPQDTEVLQQARNYLQDFERGAIADYFLEQADTFAAAARDNGMATAAAEYGLPLHDTDYFALNYGGLSYFSAPPRNSELGNISSSRSFFAAVFGTPINAIANAVSLQDRIIILAPVDERDAETEQAEMLEGFYSNFVQQSNANRLEDILLNPDYITDNFIDTLFSQVINSRG